jgi:hypothetical protein
MSNGSPPSPPPSESNDAQRAEANRIAAAIHERLAALETRMAQRLDGLQNHTEQLNERVTALEAKRRKPR